MNGSTHPFVKSLRANAELALKSVEFMGDPDLAEEAREDAQFWTECAAEIEKLRAALAWAVERVSMPGCRCSTGSDGECTCDRESWPEFQALRRAEALLRD